MSALALIVAATLAQAGALRSDLALRGGGAGRSVVDYAQWTTATTMTGSTCNARASDLLTWKGAAITFSRSDSTLCCPESDASCCWAAANQPCIHAPTYQGWASGGAVAGGIEVYGPGANGTGYSEDMSSWTAYNSGSTSPVVSTNATAAPDGTLTADEVAFGVADDSPVKYSVLSKTETYYGDASAYCQTIWAKGKTEAGTLYFGLTTTGTNGIGSCAVGTTWTRCQICQTLTAATRYFQIGPHSVDAPAWTVYLWGAQTTKTAYPVPYRATPGASSYTGTASTATTLTVPVALTDPARWAIGFTGTPTGAWQLARGAWTLGTYGSANSAALYLTTGQAVIRAQGAGDAYWQFTPPSTSNDTHTLLTEYVSGAVSLRDNGSPVTLSFAGAPTGSWTMPSTLTVGTVSGQFNGLVSRAVQCKRASGCR